MCREGEKKTNTKTKNISTNFADMVSGFKRNVTEFMCFISSNDVMNFTLAKPFFFIIFILFTVTAHVSCVAF